MSDEKTTEIQETDTSVKEEEGIQETDTPDVNSAEDTDGAKDTEDVSTEEAEDVTPNAEVTALNKRIKDKDRFIRQQHEELTSLKQPKESVAAKELVNVPSEGKPQLDNYDGYDEYNEALVDWKLDQREKTQADNAQFESERKTRQERTDSFWKKADTFKVKHPDFNEIAESPEINHIYGQAPHLADIVQSSEAGPEIAYYLGNNTDVATQIASMPPYQAAMEIGKLEAKVLTAPKPKNITQAPTPITPVGGGHDPAEKSVEDMSQAEYEEGRDSGKIK